MSKNCPFCSTDVEVAATVCRGCGAEHRRSTQKIKYAFGMSIIGFIGGSVFPPLVFCLLAVPIYLYLGITKRWYRVSNSRFDN